MDKNIVVCTDDCMVSEYLGCYNLVVDEIKKNLKFMYRGGEKVIKNYRWFFIRDNEKLFS